jgi:hypothetical protein
MLKRKIRNLAVTVITIGSATVLTALGATGASAAATTAGQPGHVDVAANTMQAAPAARGNAVAHVPAALTVPAPVSGEALESPAPHLSDSSFDSSDCIPIYLNNTALSWNDPGLHQDIRITANNTTCYTEQSVPGTDLFLFRINDGADCVKIIYPDANENEYATDQGCNINDPLEQFEILPVDNSGTSGAAYICLLTYGECLAVSAALNGEIVGGKQLGPSIWI